MKIYTVWTGSKFKGCWASMTAAVSYMAARNPEERKAWTLCEVDVADRFGAQVEAAAKALDEARSTASVVHHLKAQSIDATGKTVVGV